MEFTRYRSHLEKLLAQRNGYLVLACSSSFLGLCLVGLLFCTVGRERIILVPPVIEKSFWVASARVSPEYLSEMTAFFAYLRFNATGDSAALQQETLLRYTDPLYYNALKSQLLQEAAHLREQHVSQAFFPVDVQIDSPHLTAVISGDLHGKVGEVVLPVQRIRYRVGYRWTNGRLFVRSFEAVPAHE